MDRGVQGQYVQFLKTAAGKDLIDRLKATEAKYMMEGMKAPDLEQKGLAMERMHATYMIRTMLDDLSKPVQSQAKRLPGSK